MCLAESFSTSRWHDVQGRDLAQKNEGCQEPVLRSGREAPPSSGRRRRRATRRTRRSVSIAPPKAGRGTECARRKLSMPGTVCPQWGTLRSVSGAHGWPHAPS